MAVQDYKINYKSDFVLNINGDAGWAVPFCIKFWTGMPSQAYFVGFDGVKYVNCRVGDTPTQLLVMFDDHHLPIGKLMMQIAYHTTIAEFPGSVFDEVTNARDVIVTIDGTDYQVMLDFTGETAPELEFDLPAYANEAERIQNELQRQQNEADRIAAELQREQATAAAVQGAENVNAQLSGNTLTVTNRQGVSTSVNTKGEQGEQGPVGPEGPQGEQGVSIVDFSPKSQTATTLIYTATFSDGHTQDVAIPKGPKGDTGATGPVGPQGPQGQTGVSITGFVETGETETATLYNITFSNGTTQQVAIPKGEKGDQGEQGPEGPQGPMGDVAVITPEQQAAFTMYSTTGQNTDGPMTQKAVTDNFGCRMTGLNGYGVNLSVGIGNTVPNKITDTYATCTEFKVSEGDVICITAQGGNSSRVWGFIDENRVLLSVADAAKFYEDEILIVPEGADKVVLNAIISDTPGGIIGYPNYEWYFAKAGSVGAGAILSKFAKYTKYDNLQSGLISNNVQDALDEIAHSASDVETLNGINGYGFNFSSAITQGTPMPSLSVDPNSTCFERKVKEGDIIRITAKGGNNARAWGFIDENRYLISYAEAGVFVDDMIITTPAGADKVVLNAVTGGPNGYPNYKWEFAMSGSEGYKNITSEIDKRDVSILFIGNSLTQDAVSYVPLLLKELAPNLKFRLYIWYNGGYTLDQQLAKFNSNTACEIFSVCIDGTSWTNYNNSVTMSYILENYKFDIVSVQEYFNYQEIADVNTFNSIVEYIENSYSYPFKVVTLFHQPIRNNAETVFARTKAGNALFLKNTVAEDMIPSGIAIYRAMQTALDALGDQMHLSPDGIHSQEGLPCMMQAYVTAMWILKQVGIVMSVNNASSIVDNSNYASINVPGPNLGTGVVIGTTEQVRMSQKVAIKAFKEGEYFVNANLTEYTTQ